MEPKIRKQLEEARAHFFAWRMAEAYTLLRRFFDRLPFQAVPEHGEYISMFANVLAELGKSRELNFYVAELEKLYARNKQPHTLYALGYIYFAGPDPRPETARKIFDEILRDPNAGVYRTLARMSLANYYDLYKDDVATCRLLIDAIEEPQEERLKVRVEIWKAKLLRDEKKYDLAEAKLRELMGRIEFTHDWYNYISTKIILANLFVMKREMVQARRELEEIRSLSAGKKLRSMQRQLKYLEEQLAAESRMKVIRFERSEFGTQITHADQSVLFRRKSLGERLICLLVRRKNLNKALIMKTLYDKEYEGEKDDVVIYYQIRAVRRRLTQIGLPPEALVSENDQFRLMTEVETVEEDAW